MDVAAKSTANGANVHQWTWLNGTNQQWNITNIGNGQYSIVGVQSGKYLDVNAVSTADGANVQIWQNTGGDNQKWTFTLTDSNYFRITAVHSSKVLDVTNSSPADGANVQQWTYNGGNNQQWQLVPVTSQLSARTAAAVIQTVTTDEVAVHDIIVYPNPVAGELVVKLTNGFKKGSVITFTDVAGRLLRNLRVTGTEYVLPLSALSSGVYFIKINNGKKSITKKIIKQ